MVHRNYGFTDPNNPAVTGSFAANSTTNGVDIDAVYRPQFDVFRAFSIVLNYTYQRPKLSDVFIGQIVNGLTVNSAAAAQYNGNVPQRTPQHLLMVQPSYDLPRQLGTLYVRYKYIGKIYADSGDGLALPGYGVLTLGGFVNGLFYGRGIVGTNAVFSLTYRF